jgi:polysaccharide export outer membrane protein
VTEAKKIMHPANGGPMMRSVFPLQLVPIIGGLALCAGLGLAVLCSTPAAAQSKKDGSAADRGGNVQTPSDLRPQTGEGELSGSLADPKTFKIGPEDVVEIRVWKEPELSGEAVVRPDGKISLSLIGDIEISGMTPVEVQAKVTEELGKVMNNPVVSVRMRAIRSSKYYITGNVGRTGMFPLVVPTTVLEALTLAGGLSEWANKKKIVVLRGKDRMFFNYNDVIKGKKLEQNILLQNGDFIIVD